MPKLPETQKMLLTILIAKLNIKNSGLRWLWVGIVVCLLDQLTKYYAMEHLVAYTAVPVVPGFNLTLSYNTGAAFSFLNQADGWQVWLFGVIAAFVSVAIFVWLRRLSKYDYWVSIALSFIVGGALGNLFDRMHYGYVIDFIQLYIGHLSWPVFNVADSAICLGAVMLVKQALSKKK